MQCIADQQCHYCIQCSPTNVLFGLNQNAELEKGAKYQLLSLVF